MVEISKEMIEAAKARGRELAGNQPSALVEAIAEIAAEGAIAALRHAEPSEPVAWRYRYKGGKWVVQKNKPHWYKVGMTDVEIEPLYSSPTPALGVDIDETTAMEGRGE